MDSPLIWAGSKRWLVTALGKVFKHNGIVFDDKRRLVELFAGGASLSMGLEPEMAVLNDLNPHLMNFWRFASKGVIKPERSFHAGDMEFYNIIREQFNAGSSQGPGQAERFYALNHWCFNGIWRVNKKGEFNVPKRNRVVSLPPLPDYSLLMRKWEFYCCPFAEVLLNPGDVVFADPPYDDGFVGYTGQGFDWYQQQALAVLLAGHRGPVVATNKATPRILSLYSDCGFAVELREGTQRMHHSRGRTDENLEMIAYKGLTWVI